jgi:hypothetical protein
MPVSLVVGLWNYSKDEDNPLGDYFEASESGEYDDHIQFSAEAPGESSVEHVEIRLFKKDILALAERLK